MAEVKKKFVPNREAELKQSARVSQEKKKADANVQNWTKKTGSTKNLIKEYGATKANYSRLNKRKKWYSGDKPTERETVAEMYRVSGGDGARFSELEQMYKQEQRTIGSPIYNPYAEATNWKAIEGLAELGFDLSGGVTSEWLQQNQGLLNDKRLTTSSYNPAAPTKSSTAQQDAAYWFKELQDAEERTVAAETEYSALANEVKYWADRGYSDDAILNKVRGHFDSDYKTLSKMDEDRLAGSATLLNRKVNYSGDDTIYGMIWAARNDGGSGDYFVDSVQYALGTGKKYKSDPNSEAARDPSNAEGYHPYIGSNTHELNMKYGVDSVDMDWLEANRSMLNDPEQADDWRTLHAAVENADAASAQLAEVDQWLEQQVEKGVSADDIAAKLEAWANDGGELHYTDAKGHLVTIKPGTLAKMEEKRRLGEYMYLGYGVDFTLPSYIEKANDMVAERDAAAEAAKAEESEKEPFWSGVAEDVSGWLKNAGEEVGRFVASFGIDGIGSYGDDVDAFLGAQKGKMTENDIARKYASDVLGIEITGDLTEEEKALINDAMAKVDVSIQPRSSDEERAAASAAIEAVDTMLRGVADDPNRRYNYMADEAYTSVYEKQPEEPREGMQEFTADPVAYTVAPMPEGQAGPVYEVPESGAYKGMLQGGEWDGNAILWAYNESNNPIAIEATLVEGILNKMRGEDSNGLGASWYDAHKDLIANINPDLVHGALGREELEAYRQNPELRDSRRAYGSEVYDALMANQEALDEGAIEDEQYARNLIGISFVVDAIKASSDNGKITDEQASAIIADDASLQEFLAGANASAAAGMDAVRKDEEEAQKKLIEVMDNYASGAELDMDESMVVQSVLSMDVSKVAKADAAYQDTLGYFDDYVAENLSVDALMQDGVSFSYGNEMDMGFDYLQLQQSGAAVYSRGVKDIATEKLDREMRMAAAYGMTLDEYYEAYPERARSGEQLIAEARTEYDTAWNDFGNTLYGLEELDASMKAEDEGQATKGEDILGPRDIIAFVIDKWGRSMDLNLAKTGNFLLYSGEKDQKVSYLREQYGNNPEAFASDLNEWEKGELARLQEIYEPTMSSRKWFSEHGYDGYGDVQSFEDWVNTADAAAYYREIKAQREANPDIFNIGMTVDEIKSNQTIHNQTRNIANIDKVVAENGSEVDNLAYGVGVSLMNSGTVMAATAVGGGGLIASMAASAPEYLASGYDRYKETGNYNVSLLASAGEIVVNGLIEKVGFDRYVPDSVAGMRDNKVAHFKYILSHKGLAHLIKQPKAMSKVASGVMSGIVKGAMDSASEFMEEFSQAVVSAIADNTVYGEPILPSAEQLSDAAREGVMAFFTGPIFSMVSGSGISFSDDAGNALDAAKAQLLPEHDGAIINDAIEYQTAVVAINNSQDALVQIEASSENAAKQQAQADLKAAETELVDAQTELATAESDYQAAAVALEDVNTEMQDSDAFTEDMQKRMSAAADAMRDARKRTDAAKERVSKAQTSRADAEQRFTEAQSKVQGMYNEVMAKAKAEAEQMITDIFFGGDSEAQQAAMNTYREACARLMDAKNRLRSAKADAEMYARTPRGDDARSAYGEALLEIDALNEEVAIAKEEVEAAYEGTGESMMDLQQTEEMIAAEDRANAAAEAAAADPMNIRNQQKAELEQAKLRTMRARQALEEKRTDISKRLQDPRNSVREEAVKEWNAIQNEASAAAAESEALQAEFDETDVQKSLNAAIEDAGQYSNEQLLFADSEGHIPAVKAYNRLELAKHDAAVENALTALNNAEVGSEEHAAAMKAYNEAVEAREDEIGRQLGTTGDTVREMLRRSPAGEQVMAAVRDGNQRRAADVLEQIMRNNADRRAELVKQAVRQRRSFQLNADLETGAKGKAGVTKAYSRQAGKSLDSDGNMQLKVLDEVAKDAGFEIVIKDSLSNVEGAVNGVLSKGGTIYVGLDAIEQGYLQAGTHEMVHGIARRDAAAYGELQQAVTDILSAQGLNIDQMVSDRMQSYSDLGQQIDEAGALEEIIAESTAQIWASEANLKKFADEHPNAFKRVYDAFMQFWKKVQDISSRIAQRNDRKEITAMLSDDGAMQKVYDTFMKVAKETKLVENAESDAKYSLQETTDGRMVAVVDEDILNGIYEGEWSPSVHKAAKDAVKKELFKFADGVVVENIQYDVNRTSRKELARSGYGEALRRDNGEMFADKLRSVNVLDDVIRATVGWTSDGGLTHERKDSFVDFVRGETLIASGENKYKATMVVGITGMGQYVAYDIVGLEPESFTIKNAPSTTAYANNMRSDIHEGASETRISQNDASVKGLEGKNVQISPDGQSAAPSFSLNESAWSRDIAEDLAAQLVNNTDNAMEIADILGRIDGDMWRDHRAAGRTGEVTTANRNPIEILSDLTRSIRVGYNPGGTVSVDGERVPRAVLGVYDRFARSIATRTRDAGDLELGLHEFGHAVHDRLAGLQANDRLMNSLSQDVRDAYDEPLWEGEAIAEFVIDYVFSRDAAISLAGDDFVRDFENLLRQDRDLYNAVMNAGHQVELWNNADPESRMDAMVKNNSVDPRRHEIGNWLSRRLRDLDTGLFDYTAPAKLVSRDFHRQALYSAHARKRSDVVLNQRLIDPSGREIGQSLAERLYDAGVGEADMNAIVRFALARHALDRRRQNKDVFTPREFGTDQLQEIVARYAGTNIEAGADALTSFWNDFMDAWMVDTGLIDRETIDTMRAMYPHYVPTFRVVGENFSEFGGRRSTFQLREAVEGGSSLEVINPMISIVDQVQKVVNTVTNNQLMRAFHREMQRGGMGEIARLVPQREVAQHTDISRAMAAFNTVIQGSNADPDAVENMVRELAALEQRFIATGQGAGTNVVSGVDEYGNRFFYEIYNKPLFALMSGNVHAASSVPEAIRRFKNTFTALTTGSNPMFALKNAQRDFQASVNTGTWALTYADGMAKWIWALSEVFANSESYQQWKSMGGGSHSRFQSAMISPADAGRVAREVSNALLRGRRTSTGRFKVNETALERISQTITLEKLNAAVEDASRFAEWRFGRHDLTTDEGRMEAFMRSQDVTTNFGTHGAYGWIQTLNKVVPFMNATLQGTAKDIHIVADIFSTNASARAEALPKAGKIIMNSALTAAFQMAILKFFTEGDDDDEDYALLNDAMKAGNLIIPLPKSVRSGLEEFSGFSKPYIRVPIAQGTLHQGMHAVFLDAFANVKDYGPMEIDLMSTVFQIMAEGIPTDGTIFQAFMDAKNNKTWYGKAIENSYMQDGSEYNRYKEGTNQAVINLARAVGISPAKLDYLLSQYSGVIGKVVAPLVSGEGFKGLLNSVLSAYTIDPVDTNDLSDDFAAAQKLLSETVTDGKRGAPLGALAYGIDANAAFDEALYLEQIFESAYKEANALWAERSALADSAGMSLGEQTRTMRKIRQEINAIYEDALAEFAPFKMQYVSRDFIAMDAVKELLGIATKSSVD